MQPNQHNANLAELLYQRLSLEKDIEDAQGVITEEQDLIWQNQEMQIKDKVDAYGYVLSRMANEVESLKQLKQETSKRIQKAISRIELNTGRLKQRLNFLSEGSPLRGYIYSFHPYLAEKREVANIDLVEDDLAYLTIEIKSSEWKNILSALKDMVPEYKVVKRDIKVSQLPEDHPAVTLQRTASVRIT